MTLYTVCDLCNGTGMTMHNGNLFSCSNRCVQRNVLFWGTDEAQTRTASERASYLATLERLADGCQKKMQEFGLPYPRSCEMCGLEGKCKNEVS